MRNRKYAVWNCVVRHARATAPANPAALRAEGRRNTVSVAQKTSGASEATMSLPSLPGSTSVTTTGAVSHAKPPSAAAARWSPRLRVHPYMKKPPASTWSTSFQPSARYGSVRKYSRLVG